MNEEDPERDRATQEEEEEEEEEESLFKADAVNESSSLSNAVPWGQPMVCDMVAQGTHTDGSSKAMLARQPTTYI